MGLKLLGAALMILAGTAAGFQTGEQLKKRVEHMKKLKRLILFLRQEILYRNCTFEEAFLEIAQKMPMPYSEALQTLSESLKKPGETSLFDAWQTNWKKSLESTALKGEDIEKFCQLGIQLGYPDAKMQESAFRLYLEQLEWEINGLLTELPGKRKVCRCLGVTAGLLVTIILF